MKIKVENVYNTQAENKTLKELRKKAVEDVKKINEKLKEEMEVSSFEKHNVNWTKFNRGVDVRFSFTIEKNGRTKTSWRDVYSICNSECLRPCYFKKI